MVESLLPNSKGGSWTVPLVLSAFIGSIGAATFGFQIGAPNPLESVIKNDLGLSKSIEWPLVQSLFPAAAFFATQVSAKRVDSRGRKRFLVAVNAVSTVAGTILLVSGLVREHQSLSYGLLLLGRILFGVSSGAATCGVPVFLSEIAPDALRGSIGVFNQFQVTVWILVAQALGLCMDTSALWGWLFFVSGLLGGLGVLLTLLVLPESPRWLVSKGRDNEARAALTFLRGKAANAADIDAEIQSMRAASGSPSEGTSVNEEPSSSPTFRQIWLDGGMRRALVIAVTLQIAQQLSGINAVFFYSSSLFSSAGIANPNIATMACGAVNVVATAAAIFLIDRAGRKPLLLVGTMGMLLSAVALTVTLVEKDDHASSASSALGGVSVGFVLLFVTMFELGLGPIPWMMASEMLPEGKSSPRSTITALAAGANWLFTVVVALVFPSVQDAIHNYSFVPFIAFLTATFVFVWFLCPETKGRQPAEVLEELRHKAGGRKAAASGDTRYSALAPAV